MRDIVYLVRDIPPFVMYCVHGESGSFLLIDSTDSMIFNNKSSLKERERESATRGSSHSTAQTLIVW